MNNYRAKVDIKNLNVLLRFAHVLSGVVMFALTLVLASTYLAHFLNIKHIYEKLMIHLERENEVYSFLIYFVLVLTCLYSVYFYYFDISLMLKGILHAFPV